MPSASAPLMLTADERAALETYARTRASRADLAQRARAVLLLAEGTSYAEITVTVGWSSATIAKWKGRFEADRLAGIVGAPPRVEAATADPATRSAHSQLDAQGAPERGHTVVDAIAG